MFFPEIADKDNISDGRVVWPEVGLLVRDVLAKISGGIRGKKGYAKRSVDMVSKQANNAYFQAQASAKIHPAKLIHMMYERLLLNLTCACEGLEENDVKKRGENLSKAIAIITELNCCVTPGDESDPAQFLRGMYAAMLIELGKVAVTKDAAVIRQAHKYVSRLKEIWEETAMRENGFAVEQKREKPTEVAQEEAVMAYPGCHEKKGAVAANMCFLV